MQHDHRFSGMSPPMVQFDAGPRKIIGDSHFKNMKKPLSFNVNPTIESRFSGKVSPKYSPLPRSLNMSRQNKVSTKPQHSTSSKQSELSQTKQSQESMISLLSTQSTHQVQNHKTPLTPVDTSDPMCTRCLSEKDKRFYDYCGKKK